MLCNLIICCFSVVTDPLREALAVILDSIEIMIAVV